MKALSLLILQALSTYAVAIDVDHSGAVSGRHTGEVADLKRQVADLRDLEANARDVDAERSVSGGETADDSDEGVPVSVNFAKEVADGGNYLRRQDQEGWATSDAN